MSKVQIARDAAEKATAAETARTESLLRQGRNFAATAMIVLGFQLMDTKTLLESTSPWVKTLCYASLASLAVSLLFAFFAVASKSYAHYPRGNKLWETLKPDNVTEATAEEAIVQQLLKTREQNAVRNDGKERSLFWCGCALLGGVLLVTASQLLDAYIDTLT